ncbi:MAG: hypothetical protein ACJ8AH_12145, partial [Stellaceae bacterium]
GGQPTLDLAITEAKANIPADIKAPDSVTHAAVRVQADKIADGVWYLTGGTHHSVLVEADVFTPAAANAPRPAQPNPNSVALNDNIDRLKLTVEQILPLHGRKVSLAEFQAWIGKGS